MSEDPTFEELLQEVQEESKTRRKATRPKWMNGPKKGNDMSETERRNRRQLNTARRKARLKVRGRRKHGRPVGR
jgi:hypothetical protein